MMLHFAYIPVRFCMSVATLKLSNVILLLFGLPWFLTNLRHLSLACAWPLQHALEAKPELGRRGRKGRGGGRKEGWEGLAGWRERGTPGKRKGQERGGRETCPPPPPPLASKATGRQRRLLRKGACTRSLGRQTFARLCTLVFALFCSCIWMGVADPTQALRDREPFWAWVRGLQETTGIFGPRLVISRTAHGPSAWSPRDRGDEADVANAPGDAEPMDSLMKAPKRFIGAALREALSVCAVGEAAEQGNDAEVASVRGPIAQHVSVKGWQEFV